MSKLLTIIIIYQLEIGGQQTIKRNKYVLGHPRSSHSESLSLVLKLFSVLFLTYIGDS